MARVLGEQIYLHSRPATVVAHVAVVAPTQRAVVGGDRHRGNHLSVDVLREHAIEFAVIERLFHGARLGDRLGDECDQAPERVALVGYALIHELPHSRMARILVYQTDSGPSNRSGRSLFAAGSA